jgi:hypothetical protein
MNPLVRSARALSVLLILVSGSVWAQSEDPIDLLLNGAFRVHINARITDSGQDEALWTMEVTRVTISGRAVSLRMEGSNITVIAEFTPFHDQNGNLLLIAEGQTWVRTGESQRDVQYRTTFTTLPIALGEPIVFLPLGQESLTQGTVPVDTDRFGRLNIELEVNVVPYQS